MLAVLMLVVLVLMLAGEALVVVLFLLFLPLLLSREGAAWAKLPSISSKSQFK